MVNGRKGWRRPRKGEHAGRRKGGISRRKETKGEEGMNGVRKQRGASILLTPLSVHATLPLPDGKNG
jgi:hypothetical protein